MHLATKTLYVAVIYVLLTGCAWSSQQPGPLYPVYSDFIQAARDDNATQLKDELLSSRVVSLWNENSEQTLNDFSPIFNYVSSISAQEHSHFYFIDGKRGCLSVNVTTNKQTPATINTEFIQEQGSWKVNDIMLDMLETEEDFATEAICPISA